MSWRTAIVGEETFSQSGRIPVNNATDRDGLGQLAHSPQSVLSGPRIGDYVVLAAQCGIAGHLFIADRVTCGGRSGVISSIEEPGGTYFGYPARPLKEDRREAMRIKQLGGLLKRVKALESGALAESGESD